MKALKSVFLTLLTALPFVHLLSGCGFHITIEPGQTSAVFCDIEAGRRCATPDDIAMGVDITKPFEDGFWVGRGNQSSTGLDYSPEALAACAGGPRAVLFKGTFPRGSAACFQSGQFPVPYATVNAACKAWCSGQGWIDGDGNPFRCDDIAWQSNGAATPFADSCTDSGILLSYFVDPRETIVPVVWTSVVGADVTGSDLTKRAGVADGWGNASAVSSQQLASGDGSVVITASEMTTLRAFGLDSGSTCMSVECIDYGLVLGGTGNIGVFENGTVGVQRWPYATGDLLEVSVSGGQVRYKRNGEVLYTSTVAPTYPLGATAALFTAGATLTNARVTF
jgi:hypothetical protein